MAGKKRTVVEEIPEEGVQITTTTEDPEQGATLRQIVQALQNKTVPHAEFTEILGASQYRAEIDQVFPGSHNKTAKTWDFPVTIALVNQEDDADQDFVRIEVRGCPYKPGEVTPSEVIRLWFGEALAGHEKPAADVAAEAAAERTTPKPPPPVDLEAFKKTQAERGAALAKLVKDEQDVLSEKAQANADFNDRLKKIREAMRKTAELMNTRQGDLFSKAADA